MQRFAPATVDLLQIGGEILTTTAWQAAVMLANPTEATALIARYDADPEAAHRYAATRFGAAEHLPYLVDRRRFPQIRCLIGNALGGADLAEADPILRAEVSTKLAAFDRLTVRDSATGNALAAVGITAPLTPDPAVLTAEFIPAQQEAARGQVRHCRQKFPHGYLAVQFAACCGDDPTLNQIAEQLDAIATTYRQGIVFFCAGAAPWHDDLTVYRRCATYLRRAPYWLFTDLTLEAIVALIAASSGFIGTSLHGRIVATAFALPRLSFLPDGEAHAFTKLSAYVHTWELPEMPGVVAVPDLATAWAQAESVPLAARQDHAAYLVSAYRRAARWLFAWA